MKKAGFISHTREVKESENEKKVISGETEVFYAISEV